MPVLERHLDRHLDGGRSAVGEEYPREPVGRDPDEFARDFLCGIMCPSGKDHLVEFPRLLGDRGHDARMAVAVGSDPPAADRIDNAPPVFGEQRGALAAHYFGDRIAEPVLGEGMPDVLCTLGRSVARATTGKSGPRDGGSLGGRLSSETPSESRSATLSRKEGGKDTAAVSPLLLVQSPPPNAAGRSDSGPVATSGAELGATAGKFVSTPGVGSAASRGRIVGKSRSKEKSSDARVGALEATAGRSSTPSKATPTSALVAVSVVTEALSKCGAGGVGRVDIAGELVGSDTGLARA